MIKINGLGVSRIPINGKETLRIMKNGQQLWNGTGLPAGYTLLEYIESTGTQYIDTGFVPNNETRVVIDIEVTNSNTGFIFGSRKGTLSDTYSLVSFGSSIRYDYGSKQTTYNIDSLQRLIIDTNKNNIVIGELNEIVPYYSFIAPVNLCLLAVNTNGVIGTHIKAKLYSCKIYDNGVLIRDFIPCMNSERVYGLFDKVNRAFYQSATSTPFTGA